MEKVGNVEYEWQVFENDDLYAQGFCGQLEDALRESRNYAAGCDGKVEVKYFERWEIQ